VYEQILPYLSLSTLLAYWAHFMFALLGALCDSAWKCSAKSDWQ